MNLMKAIKKWLIGWVVGVLFILAHKYWRLGTKRIAIHRKGSRLLVNIVLKLYMPHEKQER